ncbi:hypothetical protein C8J56DRAFT_884840 [Mycena floridula]|nr:hypothetical protein C8J56DRAFT_884840 [Mycena floridula]
MDKCSPVEELSRATSHVVLDLSHQIDVIQAFNSNPHHPHRATSTVSTMARPKKILTEEEKEQQLQVRRNRARPHVSVLRNADEYKAKARERMAKKRLAVKQVSQDSSATPVKSRKATDARYYERNREDIQYRAREAYKSKYIEKNGEDAFYENYKIRRLNTSRAPGAPIVFYVLWEGPDEGIYMDWATVKRYKGNRGATKRSTSHEALSCWRWNCLQHHQHDDPAEYNSFRDPFVAHPELRGAPPFDESARAASSFTPASSPVKAASWTSPKPSSSPCSPAASPSDGQQYAKGKGKGRAAPEEPVFYVIRGARATVRYSDRKNVRHGADQAFALATAAGEKVEMMLNTMKIVFCLDFNAWSFHAGDGQGPDSREDLGASDGLLWFNLYLRPWVPTSGARPAFPLAIECKDSCAAVAVHGALQPIAEVYQKIACAALDSQNALYYVVLQGNRCGVFVSRDAASDSLRNAHQYGREKEVKILGGLKDAVLCCCTNGDLPRDSMKVSGSVEDGEAVYYARHPAPKNDNPGSASQGKCPWLTPEMLPAPRDQVDDATVSFVPLEDADITLEEISASQFGHWLGRYLDSHDWPPSWQETLLYLLNVCEEGDEFVA